ncbi:MAG: tetratricopeptide repeat protein [Candidatus Hodarchaeales archaeon]|jgi:hypothetical protein
MRLLPPLDDNFKVGVKLQRLGLFDEAITKFSTTLETLKGEPFCLYHIGECNLRKGNFENAEKLFSQIQQYFRPQDFKKNESNVKRIRIHNLYPNGVNILLMAQYELLVLYSASPRNEEKFQKIKAIIDKVKNDSKDKFDQGIIAFYNAKTAKDNDDYISAKNIAEECIKLLKDYPLWCAKVYKLLGEISWRIDNLDLGITYLEKSRSLYEELEEFDRIGLINLDIGLINLEQGNYREGSKSLQASHEFAKKTGNIRYQALSLTNIANVNFIMGEYKGAEANYREAIDIWKKIGDSSQLGFITARLTAIAKALGKEEETLKLFRECLEYISQPGWDISNWITTVLIAVDSVTGLETVENIERLLDNARFSINERQLVTLEPHYLMIKAKVELFKGNRGEAQSLLRQAEVVASEKNQIALLRKILLTNIENLLEEYLLSYNEKYLLEANKLMGISLSMSENLPIDPEYLRLLTIEAHFAIVDGDMVKSQSLLDTAEQLADERGMLQEKRRIEIIRDYASKFEKRQEKRSIESVISTISSTRYDLNISVSGKIQGAIYLMTDIGMVPIVASEEITPEKEVFHIQSAATLSFLVGQGHSYNEGVFGPIPALGGLFGPDQFLLAITKTVKDEESADPRFQVKSYCVIAVSYPKSVEKALPHRSDLEEMFFNVLREIDSKNQLTQELLEKILKAFVNSIGNN